MALANSGLLLSFVLGDLPQVSCEDALKAASAGPEHAAQHLNNFLKMPLYSPDWLSRVAPSAKVHSGTADIFKAFVTAEGLGTFEAIQKLTGVHPVP